MLKEIHEQPRVLRALIEKHITRRPACALTSWASPPTTSAAEPHHDRLLRHRLPRGHVRQAAPGEPDQHRRGNGPRQRVPLPRPEDRSRHADRAVSQSGETADTLASVRWRARGAARSCPSAMCPAAPWCARATRVFFTDAGPEIGVASTKAYTAQLMAFCPARDPHRPRPQRVAAEDAARAARRPARRCRTPSTTCSAARTPSGPSPTSTTTAPARCTSAASSTTPPPWKARSRTRRSPTSTPKATRRAR